MAVWHVIDNRDRVAQILNSLAIRRGQIHILEILRGPRLAPNATRYIVNERRLFVI